jgi:hypothetical protein
LPLLLFSSTFFSMLTGQFGQPTILGFTVLVTGLTLAALKMVEPQSKQGQAPLRAKPPPVRRGRSAYAERLHGPTLTQTNGSADQ